MALDDLDQSFSGLEFEVIGYHLALLAAIAYYGDGSIHQKEYDFLVSEASKYVKKDLPDKDIYVKELLLGILDSLKSALEEVEELEDKVSSAKSIVRTLASQISEHNSIGKEGEDRKKILNNFFEAYNTMISVDGSSNKNEYAILIDIKKVFFGNTSGCLLYFFAALVLVILGVYFDILP